MKMLSRRLRLHRCAICGRRAGVAGRHLDEPPEPLRQPEPPELPALHARWHLCDECYLAVGRELARAALRSPARVRVALGVVAAERRSMPRYHVWDERFWEQLSDRGQDRLLIWIFAIAFAVHALAFMLIAAYVAVAH